MIVLLSAAFVAIPPSWTPAKASPAPPANVTELNESLEPSPVVTPVTTDSFSVTTFAVAGGVTGALGAATIAAFVTFAIANAEYQREMERLRNGQLTQLQASALLGDSPDPLTQNNQLARTALAVGGMLAGGTVVAGVTALLIGMFTDFDGQVTVSPLVGEQTGASALVLF